MIPPSQINILWSTQGGRAKACARRTSRILRDYYYYYQQYQYQGKNDIHVQKDNDQNESMLNYYGTSFDDFGATEFLKLGSFDQENNGACEGKKLLVMFVSTTGDAEHCDCIQETWKVLLRKSLPSNQFANLYFALFCLGDRAYGPNAFCAAGRKLAARLIQLGAQVFCNVGYGDDGTPNGGVFNDLDQWIEQDFLPCVYSGQSMHSRSSMQQNNTTFTLPKQHIVSSICHHRKPLSPYDIMISSLRDKSDKSNIDNQFSFKEEWQMQQLQDYYRQFFQTLRPKNAYEYNPITGFRVSDDVHNCGNNDNESNKGPLIGSISLNKRLTSKEWVQDTRHITIHVDTTFHSDSIYKRNTSNSSKNNKESLSQSTPTQQLPYHAGDIASIIPSNPKSTVQKFISCLPPSIQSQADVPIYVTTKIVSSTQYKMNFTQWPSHCTLRGLLTFCADISSLPEREDLRSLSAYCNPLHPMGIDQREKLISLSETSDAALYGDYVIREKRNWADVLYDFDSIRYEPANSVSTGIDDNYYHKLKEFTQLNIEHLLMILSPIMPRHFSIASAPSKSFFNISNTKFDIPSGDTQFIGRGGFDIELCVAVVKGLTPHGRQFKGLCSDYLSQLHSSQSNGVQKPHDCVKLWIRPGSFRKLPLDISTESSLISTCSFETPIMCIGSGTGIAPLRALIHEREAIRYHHRAKLHVTTTGDSESTDRPMMSKCDNILVFGCRKQSEDYYYERDWKLYSDRGTLKVLPAFSQDQKHKVYVQHVIRNADEGLLLSRHILDNNGALYVAGGAKMARAVKDEIIESLGKKLPNGSNDAKKILLRLQRLGRFSVEAWN